MTAVQPAVPPPVLDPSATPARVMDVPAVNKFLDSTPLLDDLKGDDEDFERLRPPGSVKVGDADQAVQLTPQQLEFLKQMRGLISEAQQREDARIQALQTAKTQEMTEALANLNKDMQRPVPESKSLKPKVEKWLNGVHPELAPPLETTQVFRNEENLKSSQELAKERKRLADLAHLLEELDLLESTRLHYTNTQREMIERAHAEHRAAVYEAAKEEGLDVPSLEALERSFQTRRTSSIVGPRRDPTDTDPSVESVAKSGMGNWLGLGKGSMYDEVMTNSAVSVFEAPDGGALYPHAQVPPDQYFNDENQRMIRKELAQAYGEDVVAKARRAFGLVQVFPKIVEMDVSIPPSTLDGITDGPSVTASETTPPISLATREGPSGTMETVAAAGAPPIGLNPANTGSDIEGMSDDAVLDGPGFDSADIDDGRSVTGSGLGPVDDDVGSVISGFSGQGDA